MKDTEERKLLIRYFLQAIIVASIAYTIPSIFKTSLRKPEIGEVLLVGASSSLMMLVLD